MDTVGWNPKLISVPVVVDPLRGVAGAIHNGQLTFDLARLRRAIEQPKRKDRPKGKEAVEHELEQLMPGAKLVGTRGFGEAVIHYMQAHD